MTTMAPAYPITVDIDPPADQSRLTILIRLILAIIPAIVAGIVGLIAGILTIIVWFVILITGRYPSGLWNFCVGSLRWSTRLNAYALLLNDKWPPFSLEHDAAYPARVLVDEAIDGRNRLTVLFRIIMIIPHAIILGILQYVMYIVGFVAWLIGLFTGRLPDGLHNFIAGYVRWNARAGGYYLLLTDQYPPFSLN